MAERFKVCCGCRQNLPWSAFAAQTKWPDGSMRLPRWRCKPCESEYSAERQRLKRQGAAGDAMRATARAYWHNVVKQAPEQIALRRAYNRDFKRRIHGVTPDRYRRLTTIPEQSCRPVVPSAPFAAWLRTLSDKPDQVALRTGLTSRRAWGLLNGEFEQVEVDTVDRALLAVGDGTTIEDLYGNVSLEAA